MCRIKVIAGLMLMLLLIHVTLQIKGLNDDILCDETDTVPIDTAVNDIGVIK
jgi:hypothetical protein